MRSSNPAFTSSAFNDFGATQTFDPTYAPSTTMTVQGTALKSFALLGLLMVTASWSWDRAAHANLSLPLIFGSAIGAFAVGLLTTFRSSLAPITAPIYALLEGVFLGAVSFGVTRIAPRYQDLPYQAVTLTFGTMFCMLVIYATGLIRVTPRLTAGIVAATGAICLVYLASMVLSLFHVSMPIIHSATPLGIGFSLFVVALAAFNLLLDFDYIEKGQQNGLPRSMEWYGAFGLMVTLVWLYLEILRLLMKLSDRR